MPTAFPDVDIDIETIFSQQVAADLPYEVILHNDDVNTFEYVIAVLCRVFGYPTGKARKLAQTTHESGRASVWDGPKDEASSHTRTLLSYGLTATCARAS